MKKGDTNKTGQDEFKPKVFNDDDEKKLRELRKSTDEIDKKIVKLLNKRFYYSILIAKLKRHSGLKAYSPQREKEINNNIKTVNDGPIDNSTIVRIYERIVDESRALQQKIIYQKRELKEFSTSERKSVKSMFGRREYFIIGGFFFLLLLIFYYTFFTGNTFHKPVPYKFEIRYGETFTSVAKRLSDEEIIPSEFNFRAAAFIYGAETKLRSGRYFIPNNLSYLDLLDLFMYGKADFLKTLKIYNGVSSKWIAGAVNRELKVDSLSFYTLTTDRSFIDSLGIKASSLEGYLLPGKYLIFEKSSPKEVIDTLLKKMNSIFNDSVQTIIEKNKRSKHDVITMASIVEGETKKIEEMPLVAGVYYNRLRIGMKLQADPTIQFLQPNGWKRLLYKDLRINSPYNTYLYSGLPPGPINNPGKEALLASIFPAEHQYLYFVADGTGGHKFAKTYSEHLKNVRAYREWLKKQNK